MHLAVHDGGEVVEMDKKEAAQFLGVSVRTLERYTKQGKIPARYERGRTRSVVSYDPESLQHLREEREEKLQQEKLQTRAAIPFGEGTEPTDIVSFRLDPFYRKRLAEEGASEGMSAGEWARRLVVRALEEFQAAEIAELHRGLQALREELARSVAALLCAAGQETPERALQWVKDNLGK